MSATDSESSIDWLESDHEGQDSEQESNNQQQDRREMKQRDSEPWERQASGQAAHSAQPAMKRQHSSPSSQDQWQLTSSASETEQLFTRKCTELQCYIHPLSLILNGLRSGRYRERLSSFQESVAMDRIQRIMGVLRNPCMGEKYMNIILKMEQMLKSWFPKVKLPQQPATQTEEPVPSKKPKLCSTATVGPFTHTEPAVGPKALRVTDLTPPGAYSASNMKWLHTSPICSPTAEQSQLGPRAPQSHKDRDLTQDSAVSSSTDYHSKTGPAPRGPPLGKINAPCLERLLKSTESIITQRGSGTGSGGLMDRCSS